MSAEEFNAEDYIPQPTGWFEETIEYSGDAYAQFIDSKGWMKGQAKAKVDADGKIDVRFDIEANECEGKLGSLLRSTKIKNLSIKTIQGTFTTQNSFYVHNTEPTSPNFFKVVLHDGFYETDEDLEATYWLMPLVNFIYNSYHQATISIPSVIPTNLSKRQESIAQFHSKLAQNVCVFLHEDELVFIERVPEYSKRKKQLEQRKEEHEITSVMASQIVHDSLSLEDVDEWFSIDYLPLLSFASGSIVGAPWIEFRNSSGELVARKHGGRWIKPFFKGHKVIKDLIREGGWSRFLTRANPDRALRGELIVTTQAGDSNLLYIDNRLTYFFRVLDTLTKKIRQEIRSDAKAIFYLLDEMNFKDEIVIPDKEEWLKYYKHYRTHIIHECILPAGRKNEKAISMRFHLHDMILRVILRKLNYDGHYYRAIRPQTSVPLDWITGDTHPEELGY